MDPITLSIIAGTGILGSWLGSKGRKPFDPREFERYWGAQALSARAGELYKTIRYSPAADAAIRKAMGTGQMVGARVRASLARSGVSDSIIGQVAGAASRDFGSIAALGVEGDIWQSAFGAAADINRVGASGWLQAKNQYQQTPTGAQAVGAGLQGFSQAFAQAGGLKKKAAETAATTTTGMGPMPAAPAPAESMAPTSIHNTLVRSSAMNRLNPTIAPSARNWWD